MTDEEYLLQAFNQWKSVPEEGLAANVYAEPDLAAKILYRAFHAS
jgi:hypothetical protein